MATAGPGPATLKTTEVQTQIDEVVGIMQNNINKVVERGEALESLQNKTEDLQEGAMQFKRGANRVRKEMWWQDMKMKIILGVVIALVIILVIVGIVVGAKK